MEVSCSSRLMSTLGVKITRRLVIRLVATSPTVGTLLALTPNRMVPNPGTATEWPSVHHALITSPAASQQTCITPTLTPLLIAASLITLLSESLL
ncbi:Uncharacterised protein [Segatella copri]|nr:Uncharacterised protein [Segatella copri]